MSDNGAGAHDSDEASARKGGFPADLVMVLRFFSRLPSGTSRHEAPNLERMAMVLPLAGLIIGLGPAALLVLAVAIGLSPLFASLLAAASHAIVTGAMSEDAVADAADGLFGGTTRERRLEILKDSRHGTYGVLAIFFVLGLKVAALSAMAAHDPWAASAAWLGATLLARSGALYLAVALPPARREGAGAVAGRLSWNVFMGGLVLACVGGLILAAPFTGLTAFVLALACGGAVVLGWTRLCDRLVGGQTGDLTGALQALVEIALLGAFMLAVTA